MTMVQCTCKQCGKIFLNPLGKTKNGRGLYCSRECQWASLASRAHTETCQHCGTTFKSKAHRTKDGRGKFCSRKCFALHRSNKVTLTCCVCGTTFEKKPCQIKHNRHNYCSRKCLSLGTCGINSPMWRGGHTHYRGKNWLTQRELAYERDGGVCQSCHRRPRKGERKFHVHHIKPARTFNGDYIAANDLKNLITLCPKCHRTAEIGKVAVQVRLL